MPPSNSGSWSIELDCDPAAPGAARLALRTWLEDLPPRVRDNALIAATELVSNAVRFGRPPIDLRARLAPGALHVEVSDQGDGRPRRRVPADDGGVGLNIVYLLADRVVIERGRPCVRCEFATTAGAAWSSLVPPDPAIYEVELVRQAATLRIVLRGDIDLTARPELDRLFAELDPSELDRVVIDLREVTFFDTTGLHMAHRFDRWGREHGVTVVFTRPIPDVMRALESAGLALRLTFLDDAG
jgi:anti-anti-sigma factor